MFSMQVSGIFINRLLRRQQSPSIPRFTSICIQMRIVFPRRLSPPKQPKQTAMHSDNKIGCGFADLSGLEETMAMGVTCRPTCQRTCCHAFDKFLLTSNQVDLQKFFVRIVGRSLRAHCIWRSWQSLQYQTEWVPPDSAQLNCCAEKEIAMIESSSNAARHPVKNLFVGASLFPRHADNL